MMRLALGRSLRWSTRPSSRCYGLTVENRWNIAKLIQEQQTEPLVHYLLAVDSSLPSTEDAHSKESYYSIQCGRKIGSLFASKKGGNDLKLAFEVIDALHFNHRNISYNGLMSMIDSFMQLGDYDSAFACYQTARKKSRLVDLPVVLQLIDYAVEHQRVALLENILQLQPYITQQMLRSSFQTLYLADRVEAFNGPFATYIEQNTFHVPMEDLQPATSTTATTAEEEDDEYEVGIDDLQAITMRGTKRIKNIPEVLNLLGYMTDILNENLPDEQMKGIIIMELRGKDEYSKKYSSRLRSWATMDRLLSMMREAIDVMSDSSSPS